MKGMNALLLGPLILGGLILGGCATPLEEDTDAAGSGCDNPFECNEDPDAGLQGDPGASQYLYYRIGDDVWLASAAGTEARMICEDSTVEVDEIGRYALCVPNDEEQPLKLFFFDLLDINQEYMEWRPQVEGGPQISPDGNFVAYLGPISEAEDMVILADGGGNVVSMVPALGVLDFAGNEALLLDRGPIKVLWSVFGGTEEIISGNNPHTVGPVGAGVVAEIFDRENLVEYVNTAGQSRDLGPGRIGGVYGQRVLVIPKNFGLDEVAVLHDVADPGFAIEIPLPQVPFDRIFDARLVGPNGVLLEEKQSIACPGVPLNYSMQTTWYDVESGESYPVADTGRDPHRVRPDALGVRALVLTVDECGTPTGEGHIVELASGAITELTDYIAEPVLDGSMSPDGRFVALSLASGVQVLDLALERIVVAGTGSEGGAVFKFR
ncbi:MAG: hypothetical protein ACE366_11540 [Bradymonadia bacterium]